MRDTHNAPDVFSIEEIAAVAGVSTDFARQVARQTCAMPDDRAVSAEDAVRVLRILRGDRPLTEEDRIPLTLAPDASRRAGRGLAASGALHVAGLIALLLAASLGLLSANDTELEIKDPTPVKIVYLMALGPGGGGGGGGLKSPIPPPPAARKAALVRKTASPVPPVRRRPAPPPRPTPVRPPRPEPTKIEPLIVETKPPEPQSVKAPVVAVGSDLVDAIGMLAARPPSPPSQGSGSGGGVGSGTGTGIGEGNGSGIGPGSGGGIGGGNYGAGAGVDPPRVLREVRPTYTDEARRRSIEGDVELEIVVRRDGSVGNVRVRRTLGAGLEQKAIEAVRQWRFEPARRQGAPVEVTVDVSVEFKLRVP
jgi:periplasmic protein TonB